MKRLIVKLILMFLNAKRVLVFERDLTPREIVMIVDYVNGKRFMSRYHAGQKKVKKERKGEGRE